MHVLADCVRWLIAHPSRADDGQGLAEYALILSLIAMVAIVAVIFLGGQISGALSMVGTSIQSVTP